MAFWHDARKSKDPKRQYRWVLTNDHIPSYTLKSVSKPSFTVTQSEHQFLNHTYYYPGRMQWNTVSMTLVDPVDPDAAAPVLNVIRDSGYSPAISANDRNTMSKQQATIALGEIRIEQIDADGNAVETWRLWNPFIVDAKFGDLSYDGDDLTQIELEVRYDYAYLETANESRQNSSEFFKPGS